MERDKVITDETRRRMAVMRLSVDMALKTLEEYDDLLRQVTDGSYYPLPAHHIREIMTVLEHVADGVVENAYVDGVSVRVKASRLHELLQHEFPDITQ